MFTRAGAPSACIVILTLLFLPSDKAHAKDWFLTIGGGYSPAGNQVSLEKNVIFFKRLLSEQYPKGAPHEIYFADGNSPFPDLQYDPKRDTVPEANRLMARFLGSEDYLGYEYRDNELKPVNGIASPENIEAWFRKTTGQLKAKDRVIIYVTAHGGKSRDRRQPFNTTLHLWDNRSINVSKLSEHIESLPPQVAVVMVMVQCYSGGFSHLIFKEGKHDKGLSDRTITGFFATVQDRVAAGCTPDISEENYQEYSSSFWSAIRGKTRLDKSVDSADYDHDARISFEEAHIFTILHSTTIDIPIRTSGAFLREFSKQRSKEAPDLLTADESFSDLLELARPAEKIALTDLSKKLTLSGEDRGKKARATAEVLEKERKDIERTIRDKKRDLSRLRGKIRGHLKKKWPDLYADFSPTAIRLLTTDKTVFVNAVKSHPDYHPYEKLDQEINQLDEKEFQVEKQWVQYQRFLRVLENVALAANLPKVADEKVVTRFAELLKAECETLGNLFAVKGATGP